MARIARVALPDIPYHITHRGNHRAEIFFSDEDRDVYRALLQEYCNRYRLEIWAYCLMTNHIHLIGVGRRPDSLARGIGLAHMRYSRGINRQRGWTGHMWANRFFSTPLDEEHLWSAVRYVELNPVRAGMVSRAEEYPWSSARVHAGMADRDGLLASERPFPGEVKDWSGWLANGMEAEPGRFDLLRRNTATGRPSGSPEFIRRLENELDRLLRPQKRGRKPRAAPCDRTPDLFDSE